MKRFTIQGFWLKGLEEILEESDKIFWLYIIVLLVPLVS